jgi:hypothetical protein
VYYLAAELKSGALAIVGSEPYAAENDPEWTYRWTTMEELTSRRCLPDPSSYPYLGSIPIAQSL